MDGQTIRLSRVDGKVRGHGAVVMSTLELSRLFLVPFVSFHAHCSVSKRFTQMVDQLDCLFSTADTQLYERLCPSIGPCAQLHKQIEGNLAFRFFLCMCVCEGKKGSLGVNGVRTPLPTRPQQYCDPASFVYKKLCPSVGPSVGLSVGWTIRPSVHPSVRLSVCPSVRLSVRPSVRPSVHLLVYNT